MIFFFAGEKRKDAVCEAGARVQVFKCDSPDLGFSDVYGKR